MLGHLERFPKNHEKHVDLLEYIDITNSLPWNLQNHFSGQITLILKPELIACWGVIPLLTTHVGWLLGGWNWVTGRHENCPDFSNDIFLSHPINMATMWCGGFWGSKI